MQYQRDLQETELAHDAKRTRLDDDTVEGADTLANHQSRRAVTFFFFSFGACFFLSAPVFFMVSQLIFLGNEDGDDDMIRARHVAKSLRSRVGGGNGVRQGYPQKNVSVKTT